MEFRIFWLLAIHDLKLASAEVSPKGRERDCRAGEMVSERSEKASSRDATPTTAASFSSESGCAGFIQSLQNYQNGPISPQQPTSTGMMFRSDPKG